MMDKMTVAMSPTVIMPIPITFHCVASSAEVVGASGTLENVGAIVLDIGAEDVSAAVDSASVLDIVIVPDTIAAAEAVLCSEVVAVRLVVVLRYICAVLVIAVAGDRSGGVSGPRSATRSRLWRGTAATTRTRGRRMSERMCRR